MNRAFLIKNDLKCGFSEGFSDPKNLYYVKIKANSENLSETPLSGWL